MDAVFAPEIVRRAAGLLKPQSHEERRALSQGTLYRDRSAHLRDELPAHRDPEAGTLHSGNIVKSSHMIEQSLLQFTAHSDSVIPDFE